MGILEIDVSFFFIHNLYRIFCENTLIFRWKSIRALMYWRVILYFPMVANMLHKELKEHIKMESNQMWPIWTWGNTQRFLFLFLCTIFIRTDEFFYMHSKHMWSSLVEKAFIVIVFLCTQPPDTQSHFVCSHCSQQLPCHENSMEQRI